MIKVRRIVGVFLLLAAAFLFMSFVSGAEAATISIKNNTGDDIHYLYISASGTSDWEDDVLGQNTLDNGDTLRVKVTGKYSMFDLRVEDDEGNSLEFYKFPGNTTQITLRNDGTAEHR